MKHIVLLVCTCFFVVMSFAQYIDLPADIDWQGGNVFSGTATLASVQDGYNHAREQENIALGTSLPPIQFPPEQTWNAKTINQKALWILNNERVDRGLIPFEGTAQQLIDVAQEYTQYMADNDTISHFADGRNPRERMEINTELAACMSLPAENIAFLVSTHSQPPIFPIERMMYWLIYEDAIANWGHRRSFFIENHIDDSGEIGKEGLMGVGLVIAEDFYYFNQTWNYVVISTYKMIDPCADWVFPVATNIGSVSDSQDIHVSFSDNLLLCVETTSEAIQHISLFDIQGRCVLNSIEHCISIVGVSSGMYSLQIVYQSGVILNKKISL